MVDYIFQLATIPLCFCLAGAVVFFYFGDNRSILSIFKNSRLSHVAVLTVGNFCRLFKLFYLSFELNRVKLRIVVLLFFDVRP